MQNKKKIFSLLISSIAVLSLSFNSSPREALAEQKTVCLGGFTAGFTLSTNTVQVVGVCEVLTEKGLRSPARECGIKAGDVIININGREITSASDVNSILNEDYKQFEISLRRNGQEIKLNAQPAVEKASGNKRLGLLIKDTVNGIGTVTYIDKENNKIASLGHPVCNNDNQLIDVCGGTMYGCAIYGVKRGVRGTPGELKGAFDNTTVLGNVTINCDSGVYANIANDYDCSKLVSVSTATISDVTIGEASIYSTVNGCDVKEYAISIVKVDENNRDNRNFVIKVEDESLIEQTGGIVQGMSGSPIVQNGKLVGAVTHVFINDPTRGFGISIENMINN